MMKQELGLFTLLMLVFLSACEQSKPKPIRGFYYWKTQFELNESEQNAIKSLDISTLYVRIFDVDWNYNKNQAIPKGSQTNTPIFPKGIDPVPTIYLTNRSLQKTSLQGVDSLAQKILTYTRKILNKWPVKPIKIQLDVDWTESTKEKYFKLLSLVKASNEFKIVSSTIRLHQYKYPNRTGVPPVDEGILMCYNTGEITEWQTENAIATLRDIQLYLHPKDPYPISLGIALPIFSWTVVFRDSVFFKIITNNDLSWQQDTVHYQNIDSNRYQVVLNTYLNGHYLYKGDLLRYETIKAKDLIAIAESLNMQQYFQEVILYHLSEDNLNNYDDFYLTELFEVFD